MFQISLWTCHALTELQYLVRSAFPVFWTWNPSISADSTGRSICGVRMCKLYFCCYLIQTSDLRAYPISVGATFGFSGFVLLVGWVVFFFFEMESYILAQADFRFTM